MIQRCQSSGTKCVLCVHACLLTIVSNSRSGTDDLLWVFLIRFTRPSDVSNRARRDVAVTRFPDATSIPRFRSARFACTPSGASRNCSFVRTAIDLLRTLDFFVVTSRPILRELCCRASARELELLRYKVVLTKALKARGRQPRRGWTRLGAPSAPPEAAPPAGAG